MPEMRSAWLPIVVVAATLTAAGHQAVPAPYHERIPGTLVSFDMIAVPAGSVIVGDAGATRTIDVPAFLIGRHEVTWDLFDVYQLNLDEQAATGGADAIARPSSPYGAPDRGWGHAGYPVMSVTRHAAESFCRWLSAKTGKTYRLPSDVEWSRAASLATAAQPLTPAGRDAIAWHQGNSGGRAQAIGKKNPDALGLFDLFGNVAEWVTTESGALVTRGGSYRDAAGAVGPEARAMQDPTWNQTDPQLPKSRWWLSDGPFVGFRLVSSAISKGSQP